MPKLRRLVTWQTHGQRHNNMTIRTNDIVASEHHGASCLYAGHNIPICSIQKSTPTLTNKRHLLKREFCICSGRLMILCYSHKMPLSAKTSNPCWLSNPLFRASRDHFVRVHTTLYTRTQTNWPLQLETVRHMGISLFQRDCDSKEMIPPFLRFTIANEYFLEGAVYYSSGLFYGM